MEKAILLGNVEEKPIEFLKQEDYNQTSDMKLNEALRAAEAHRRIRYKLHKFIKPGVSLNQIIDIVENSTRILLAGEKNNGIGFPCGVCINSCAAHFSLNPNDKDVILKPTDVLKIDFGVHVNGRIMDSAFTVCFDPAFEKLLETSQEATERGLKVIGIDMKMSEIGREINEVFRSAEMVLGSVSVPIRAVKDLSGHSIEQYVIHGGLSIPQYDNGDKKRMGHGFAAIETFATTGKGRIYESGSTSHYMINRSLSSKNEPKDVNTKRVYKLINDEIGTLPFSLRHLEFYESGSSRFLKFLANRKLITAYPPLYDIPESLIAQFEHTLYIDDKGIKHVLTKGDDY